jgi:predicted enzyme related to lactoylglutathione lyase
MDIELHYDNKKMKSKTSINRINPNIYSLDLVASKKFYTIFLEMDLVMDMEWIVTFASRQNPSSQISVMQYDKSEKLNNTFTFISIEVSDIDIFYEKAMKEHLDIVYPITDEDWGVRRFFIKDPNGVTLNLLTHS